MISVSGCKVLQQYSSSEDFPLHRTTYRFSFRAFKCTSANSSVPKKTVLHGGADLSVGGTIPWT